MDLSQEVYTTQDMTPRQVRNTAFLAGYIVGTMESKDSGTFLTNDHVLVRRLAQRMNMLTMRISDGEIRILRPGLLPQYTVGRKKLGDFRVAMETDNVIISPGHSCSGGDYDEKRFLKPQYTAIWISLDTASIYDNA